LYGNQGERVPFLLSLGVQEIGKKELGGDGELSKLLRSLLHLPSLAL